MSRTQTYKPSRELTAPEPIALVGIGCRFPGGIKNVDDLWNLLANKTDAIREIPKDRWDYKKFYYPTTDKPGKSYTRWGGFLHENIDEFDPLFFGISPREAESMDPQQCYALQVTYEAIEDSGLTLGALKESNTGVFIGGFTLDNKLTQLAESNLHLVDSSTATSVSMAILANRVSHAFDFRGPSLSIDTACSSSMVAVHLAVQNIRNGDCDVAVAGGVTIMTRPEYPIIMSNGGYLSKHGRCMAFDKRAEGYSRGEGCGIVVLKPLNRAIEDGDNIYSVIRNSGINQDGATKGIAFPNGEAQQTLIEKVYKEAGVSAADIHVVEAHGTGTQAGDTTECKALHGVMSGSRRTAPLIVGSIKTNIGHLEAAAGVAGLIKASLMINKAKVLPNIHFETPNPDIPFDEMGIHIPTEVEDWPKHNTVRRASINSFGYGGTNAHVLIENADHYIPKNSTLPNIAQKTLTRYNNTHKGHLYLLPISAQDDSALRQLASLYALQLRSVKRDDDLHDLLHSATHRRSFHRHRACFAGETAFDLAEQLDTFSQGGVSDSIHNGIDQGTSQPTLIYVCTGMGPQWYAMGMELYNREPVFSEFVDRADRIFKSLSGWSLLDEMQKDESESRMGDTTIAQPANFVLQTALFELYKHYGIQPDVVIGHSVGEVAAAYISGSLSLSDALCVSYHRSQLQSRLAGTGSMLAVALSEEQVTDACELFADVEVAAVNSPHSVTLAGDTDQLNSMAADLGRRDIFNRILSVEVPYHSAVMDSIKAELLTALSHIVPAPPTIPMYSTVTGDSTPVILDAQYWWSNVRQPVLFQKAIHQITTDTSNPLFLEVGPHPVLKSSIVQTLEHHPHTGALAHTLTRKQPEVPSMRMALAQVFTHGYELDWQAVNQITGNYTKLPRYPWTQSVYKRISPAMQESLQGNAGHVLFGKQLETITPTWEFEVNNQLLPWLPDHRVEGSVVMPGAAYVEFGLALGLRDELQSANVNVDNGVAVTLQDIQFHRVLVDEETSQIRFQSSVDKSSGRFELCSRTIGQTDSSALHASGKVIYNATPEAHQFDIDFSDTESLDIEIFYQNLAHRGLEYGPAFQTVTSLTCLSKKEVVARLHLNADTEHSRYFLHPTLLDGCFQSLLALIDQNDTGSTNINGPYVPVTIDQLHIIGFSDTDSYCYTEITSSTAEYITANMVLFNSNKQVTARLQGVRFQPLTSPVANLDPLDGLFHQMEWQQFDVAADDNQTLTGNWLIYGPDTLTRQLSSHQIFAQSQVTCLTDSGSISDRCRFLESQQNQTDIIFVDAFSRDALIDSETDLAFYKERILLIQALLTHHGSADINLHTITCGAQVVAETDTNHNVLGSTLNALGVLLENEHPNIHCYAADVEHEQDILLYLRKFNDNQYRETACRGGQWYRHCLTATHLEPSSPATQEINLHDQSVAIRLREAGDVESFYLKQVTLDEPAAHEVQIKIHASSLNFKDVLKVYGQIDSAVITDTYCSDTLGSDASGIITKVGKSVHDFQVGDEVMAVLPDSFRSYANVDADYVISKPPTLNHREAPALVSYLTAWYGLMTAAQLQRGEHILIHNATGGVGYVALQIARHKKATVYATAGTEEKRQTLRSLGVRYVYDSRNLQFIDKIRSDTNGRGVDIVLNAMAGEALSQSFELLAPFGRFIEIGKKNISDNHNLPMRAFQNNLSFIGVDIDRMLFGRKDLAKQLFADVKAAFDNDCFGPIPVKVFSADDASEAFQYMARSQHVGKIVLDFANTVAPVVAADTRNPVIRNNACYLITGGTSGFGLEIAKWLAQQGAGELVLVSRSGSTKETRAAVPVMESLGASVRVIAADVTSKTQVEQLVASCNMALPLRGVFHGAVVLEDGFINTLSVDSVEKVLRPKLLAAQYLHQLTENLSLDIFFCFSSISALIGNTGQASYVIANAYLDSLCRYRKAAGLPGISLNWGAISDVGIVSRKPDIAALFEKQGLASIDPLEACSILDRVLTARTPQLGAFRVDWAQASESTTMLAHPRSRFASVVPGSLNKENTDDPASRYKDLLQSCPESMKPETYVQLIVTEQLSQLLKIPVDQIDIKRNIIQMGIDSLSAVELGMRLRNQLGVEYPPVKLLAGPTPSDLCDYAFKVYGQTLPAEAHQVVPNTTKPNGKLAVSA